MGILRYVHPSADNKPKVLPKCHILFFQAIYKKISKVSKTVFVYILGFNFYGVSCAKTGLHNKYISNFVFG